MEALPVNLTTQTQTIAERAMLVTVNISTFNAIKTDAKITREVADSHNSDVTMGQYKKATIAKEALEPIKKLAGEIRTEHYRRTLPWGDDGSRILTGAGYWDYADWMRQRESDWTPLVDAFLTAWPSYVDDARQRLNGLFNPADYPSAYELRRRFSFRWTVRPVPTAGDFRVVELGAAEVDAIRQQIEDDSNATVQAAMADVWDRIKTVVSAMAERLRAYDPAKPGASPFRDSLVENIQKLLDVLPSLNLTNDPNVARFADEMRELCAHDAQSLRDNMFTREDVAAKAEAMLDQMRQFVA